MTHLLMERLNLCIPRLCFLGLQLVVFLNFCLLSSGWWQVLWFPKNRWIQDPGFQRIAGRADWSLLWARTRVRASRVPRVCYVKDLVIPLATGSDPLSHTGTHHGCLWEIPSVTLLAWPLPWWASWDTSARPCYSSSCPRCSTSSTHCLNSCISSPALATVCPGSCFGVWKGHYSFFTWDS